MTAHKPGSFYRPSIPLRHRPGHTILHYVVASCLVSFPKMKYAAISAWIGITYEGCFAPCQAIVQVLISNLAGEHDWTAAN
jgi:hypothetical protein